MTWKDKVNAELVAALESLSVVFRTRTSLARELGVASSTVTRWYNREQDPRPGTRDLILRLAQSVSSTNGGPIDVQSSSEASASKEDRGMGTPKEQLHVLVTEMSDHEAKLLQPIFLQIHRACRSTIDSATDKEEDRQAS